MIEDKLTREDRIRLEALNQANLGVPGSVENKIEAARRFERYIRGDDQDRSEDTPR